jgi:hypothetical protein
VLVELVHLEYRQSVQRSVDRLDEIREILVGLAPGQSARETDLRELRFSCTRVEGRVTDEAAVPHHEDLVVLNEVSAGLLLDALATL